MRLTFGNGNIGVVIESNAGAVHTTSVYIFPVAYLAGILLVIIFVIWLRQRSRAN